MSIQPFQMEVPFEQTDKTKLDGVTTGAEPNSTQVDAGEKTAGTETALRSFSPEDIKDMATTHGGGGGTDAAAIHDNVAAEISTITEKVTPVAADLIIIEDSADSNNKKRVQVGNLPGGGGSTLQRYVASATGSEEVEVFATGLGVTYSRTGTTGTFVIPGGVRLMGARMRLPMASIGGTTFTIEFSTNGGFDGNSSLVDMYPPMTQVWNESTGAQVGTNTNIDIANFDKVIINSLAGVVSNMVRLQW